MDLKSLTDTQLEQLVLAHRHLYYNGRAVLDDYHYDKLEAEARRRLPESSLVHGVGGESEDPAIIELAEKLESEGDYF